MNALPLGFSDETLETLKINFGLKVEVHTEFKSSFKKMAGQYDAHSIQIYGNSSQFWIRVRFEPPAALVDVRIAYPPSYEACVAPTGDKTFDTRFSVSSSSPEKASRATGAISAQAKRHILDLKPLCTLKIADGQIVLYMLARDGLDTTCLTSSNPDVGLIPQLIKVAQMLEKAPI